jgi:hypothetical protein
MLRATPYIGVTLIWSAALLAIVVTVTTEEHTRTAASFDAITSPVPAPDVIVGRLHEVTQPEMADLVVMPVHYPAPPPTPEPELCDEKSGTCWRWGAWRYSDDSLYIFFEEKNPPISYYSANGIQAASVQPASGGTVSSYEECLVHPDRYNWMAYAVQYDWPLDELANVIQHESGGDLCAINPTSGATCWIQNHPGGAAFLDPQTCMAQGYGKWISGGRSFATHWYAFW